jgi:hypothetical protein
VDTSAASEARSNFWRNACKVGANWSGANANFERKSKGAVVWFKPTAKTLIG